MPYCNEISVSTTFEEAKIKLFDALKIEGFGVLTEIDIAKTLKNKLNVDFRRYEIIGACNPSLAYEALQTEDNIGLMLPCNIVLQQSGEGKVKVSAINPVESMQAVGNQKLSLLAEKVSSKLKRVLDHISLY